MKNVIITLALWFLVTACVTVTSFTTGMPTATPLPTQSNTPEPTLTPTPIPTLSAATGTSTPGTPSATPTTGVSFPGEPDCKLISQSVRSGAKFNARERFSVGWKVMNTGADTWEPGSVQFVYVSGTRMHQYEAVQLETSVNIGETIALTADFIAPKSPGKYSTAWSLRRGTDYFCRVSVSITVP